MERSYIAFISYKHSERDAAIAKTVHSQIERYIIPKTLRKGSKKLGIVFRDEEELPISSDLTDSLQRALDASRYLIVICSPEASQSPWVGREIEHFLQNHSTDDVFVVLAKGEPSEVFPYRLTHVLDPNGDGEIEVEPLALDARAETTGAAIKKLKKQLKKLYAAMLGCSYDSLVQREKLRRMKQRFAVMVGVVLLACCFAGLLFTKNKEISQKNDQLLEATNAAMLREAQLLTKDAEEALENSDLLTGIRYATEALHMEDMERPYYAPAERVLFSALDVFQSDTSSVLVSEFALPHQSPVEMVAYSADGTSIFSIDSYGTVLCFDATTGQMRWSTKLSSYKEDVRNFMVTKPQIMYDAANETLVCYYFNAITGLDGATGQNKWYAPLEEKDATLLTYHQQKGEVTYIEECTTISEDWSEMRSDFSVVSISTKDGRVLRKLPLCSATDPDVVHFTANNDQFFQGKYLDEDRFIGTYYAKENDEYKTMFYVADLAAGTVDVIEDQTHPDSLGRYNHLGAYPVGEDLVVVVGTNTSANVLDLRCYDLSQRSILWENTIEESGQYIPNTSDCFVIPWRQCFMIGIGDNMYLIDTVNGELMSRITLYANLESVYPVSAGMFGFVLADGYHAIGWAAATGFRDSQFFKATLTLGKTAHAVAWQGGPLQATITDGSIDMIQTVPVAQGGGRIAYVAEDGYTVYAVSALPQPQRPDGVSINSTQPLSLHLGGYIDENKQGQVLVGPTRIDDSYGLLVVDTAKRTATPILMDSSVAFADQHMLTSGGDAIVVGASGGFLWRVGMDGSVAVLSEYGIERRETIDDIEILYDQYDTAMARQYATGKLLSVRLDRENMTTWVDGQPDQTIPLPAEVRSVADEALESRCLFALGENGVVLIGDNQLPADGRLKQFAVYHMASNTWQLLADDGPGNENRKIAFAKDSPLFAVYDIDMNMRIYNAATGDAVRCISTQVPLESICSFTFVADDQYLFAVTKEGRCIAYSLEDGSVAFDSAITGHYTAEDVSSWYDRTNQRMYLRMGEDAVCMDVRSWEPIFTFDTHEDFLFYNEGQNEVYIHAYTEDNADKYICAYPVPATDEIVEMALQVLQ